MSVTRRTMISAWLGFALAALVFYPLAIALDTDIYYLQWQWGDIVETAVALAAAALVMACALFALWPRSSRRATLALVALAVLPLASFVAGVARQLPFDDALRSAWGESRALRYAAPAIVAAVVTFSFVRWPGGFNRWFRRLLIGLSPVALVVMSSFVTSASRPAPTLVVERTAGSVAAGGATGCAPVLALLFDELSFSYLYDDGNDVRQEFPEIRRLASMATNHLSVEAPGHETLIALPSFLVARHLRDVRVEAGRMVELDDEGRLTPFSATEPDGLFATARRLGFSTEMAGYYLPYCDLLGDLVDACRSWSFYNVSTTDESFAPGDPLLTTLVLWPRQFPFGLLKNPPFALLQRKLVEETVAFAQRPMETAAPVFRFIHFSVPHLPFVFDAEGYDPPFDPLQTAPDAEYVEQLQYVDRLFGGLGRHLRETGSYDRTTVVLLADHGFRFGGRERNPLRIPFIVKAAGQTGRLDVTTPSRGELLLKQVVERACATPQPPTS